MQRDVHFFCFRLEIPFLDKFGRNNNNSQFKLKFGTSTNSNKQNLMVLLSFPFSTKNALFEANLVAKLNIACLT